MGKTGRWIKHLFAGKKDVKSQACNGNDHPPGKERRRWSFRGSVGSRPERGSMDHAAASGDCGAENDAKKHALAVADLAVATAAAADAAVAAAKAAAAVIQLTTAAASGQGYGMDVAEAAAIRIQSVFRAHLARKALNALRGLVKLQALVRGHLVRKQATATLRCMQALITVQARARAHRLQMAAANETKEFDKKKHHNGKFTLVNRTRNLNNDCEKSLEEKIVEMDLGCSKPTARARNSYSNHTQTQRIDQRIPAHRTSVKQENQQVSPAASAMAEMSPRASSNHFEDYSFGTVQSSPQCYSAMSKPDLSKMPFSYARSEYGEPLYYDFAFYPNYMSNTESSRAKVRSHSAPKCRPADAFDRQPSRRRPSMEGRSLPKAVKMQRSSSQVSSNTQNYQLPCSVKLEKSTASECGSTATYRSIVGFEVQGARI